MGEVYRARDTRVDRPVALKVLPEDFLEGREGGERKERFEREGRLLASLNHPNVAVLYSFEEIPGPPSSSARHIIVMELLEGETLRQAIAPGKLPMRKAVDFGIQIALGLAAAHEKGVVHRDLKPENLFVTKDGRVKILDFGLAKLDAGAAPGEVSSRPTAARGTEPGVVLGTMGYMSPEQVRGRRADARSDLFAFGAVLYEMLAGRKAFGGDSSADVISAILREEPADISLTNQAVPPALERIVRRCLEKSPEQRFQSAGDLAFALESLSTDSAIRTAAAPGVAPSRAVRRRATLLAAGVALLAAGFFVGRVGRKTGAQAELSFSQLTFRQEPIFNARFAPDGKTVFYSAAPSGNVPEIFSLRPDYPGVTARGLKGVQLLSISSKGELAVLTRARHVGHSFFVGTLSRMPLEGGAPREILGSVREADWSPDGSDLAVIRDVAGKDRLEFPAGKVLCEAGGYLSNPRFSPDGRHIAFFEHPMKYDDRGLVAVVDLSGKRTVLSEGYWGEEGLAWSADGSEVLFSAGTAYNAFVVYAVTLSGRTRTALQSAGGITIQDVGRDGRWLTTRDDIHREVPVLAPGKEREEDLSWLDLSEPAAMSPDGRALLIREESGSVGVNYAVCLRQTDGSPVVKLGEGGALDLSRDGKWALAVVPTTPQQLVVYPTCAGTERRLDRGAIVGYETGRFFPDGRRILACGHEEGHAVRCYVQDLASGKPRPVTPEGTTQGWVSPDGASIVVAGHGGDLQLFPAEGGEPRPVKGAEKNDEVLGWPLDGRSLFVRRPSEVPARVETLDLSTGARRAVKAVGPASLAGVLKIPTVVLSSDAKWHGYSCLRSVSHLFLVGGAR